MRFINKIKYYLCCFNNEKDLYDNLELTKFSRLDFDFDYYFD